MVPQYLLQLIREGNAIYPDSEIKIESSYVFTDAIEEGKFKENVLILNQENLDIYLKERLMTKLCISDQFAQ